MSMQVFTLATSATLPQARVARPLAAPPPARLAARDRARRAPAASRPAAEVRGVGAPALRRGAARPRRRGLIARHDEEDSDRAAAAARLLTPTPSATPAAVLHLPPSAWVLGRSSRSSRRCSSARRAARADGRPPELPDDGLQPTRAQLEQAGRIDRDRSWPSTAARAARRSWRGGAERRGGVARIARRPRERRPPGGPPWLARFLELGARALLDGGARRPRLQPEHVEPARHTLEAGRARACSSTGAGRCGSSTSPGFDPDRPHRLGALARAARGSAARRSCASCASRYAAGAARGGLAATPTTVARSAGASPTGSSTTTPCARCYARALALGEDFGDLFSEEGTRRVHSPGCRARARGRGATASTATSSTASRASAPTCCAPTPTSTATTAPSYVAWCWAFGRERARRSPSASCPRPPGRSEGEPRRPHGRARRTGAAAAAPTQRATRHGGSAGAARRCASPATWATRSGWARPRAATCEALARGRRAGEHGERATAPPGAAGRRWRPSTASTASRISSTRAATASRSSRSTPMSSPTSWSAWARTTSRARASASGAGRRTASRPLAARVRARR